MYPQRSLLNSVLFSVCGFQFSPLAAHYYNSNFYMMYVYKNIYFYIYSDIVTLNKKSYLLLFSCSSPLPQNSYCKACTPWLFWREKIRRCCSNVQELYDTCHHSWSNYFLNKPRCSVFQCTTSWNPNICHTTCTSSHTDLCSSSAMSHHTEKLMEPINPICSLWALAGLPN